MENKYSFWDLINGEYNVIEIPKIQRDYAQGRESEKISEIRNDFIEKIHESLINEKELCLDFIYGVTKRTDTENKFIPLDGQQRLTTLFLLFWYILAKEKKYAEIKKLHHFKYETRITSRDFCEMLVEIDLDKFEKSFSKEKLSSEIKNLNNYFLSWNRDPSIRAMLVMLDKIHEVFKNEKDLSERLTTKKIIYFYLLELENFGLEDDLYIKMNARGEQLTEFEEFKAKLELEIKNSYKDKLDTFSRKIDNEWADIFWKFRDKDKKFDQYMLKFIKNLLMNNYTLITNIESNDDIAILNKLITDTNHIGFKFFKSTNCINLNFLNSLENFLNNYQYIKEISENQIIDFEDLFKKAIGHMKEQDNSEKTLDLTERIQLYSICVYLNNNQIINKDDFNNWIRIIRNLTENSNIYINEYIKVIKALDLLGKYSGDIVKYIANEAIDIQGFSANLINVERIKAKLLLKDNRWKEKILEIDSNSYLKGQAEFLFEYSGILEYFNKNNNLDWNAEEDSQYFNSLSNYYKKVDIIFMDNTFTDDSERLLNRALLTKGDYLLFKGRNLSFLIRNDRDISWKSLFREKDYNKREYFKELLEDISNCENLTSDTLRDDLRKIIDTSLNHIEESDWRKYFIKYPELINVCGSSLFIRKEDDKKIYLLTKPQTYAYNWDYYTYALKLELEEKGCKYVRYDAKPGRDNNEKNITEIDDFKDLKLRYDYNNETKEGMYIFESSTLGNYTCKTKEELYRFLEEKKVIKSY